MSNDVIETLHDFCQKNDLDIRTIDEKVVQSCALVVRVVSDRNDNEVAVRFNKAGNDLLLVLETAEFDEFFARFFSEATANAKCYDIYNTGAGVKMIVTYEKAFK